MSDTLFLLKSAQAKQFFQQNITLLAQPEGYQIVTRYKKRWVAHDLDGPLPEAVVVAYSEPPYDRLLPVRRATLDKIELDEGDESVLFYLTLGPLLPPAQLDESNRFYRVHRPPNRAIVFTAPAPPLPSASTSADERWGEIVAFLTSPNFAEPNPYATAVFSFAHPLTTADGQPVDPQRPLMVGQSYQQALSVLAPGLSNGTLSQVQAHLTYPRLTALVTSHGKPHEGEVTLLIQPLRTLAAPWTTTVFFRPTEVPSGPVHLTMPPIVQLPATTASSERPPSYQGLQLFEWLSDRLNPRDQLRLLDRYLLPRSDGTAPDPHLLLARATLLKQEGRPSDAVDTLLQIPSGYQNDEALVLLVECAVATERQLVYTDLLDQISDWENGQRVQRLVRAFASLPEEKILPLAYHLCELAPLNVNLVWQELGAAIHRLRHRYQLVRFLQGETATQPRDYLRLPPNEVYAYLARNADPDRISDEHLAYLIDVGLLSTNPSGFAGFFLEWMTRRLRLAGRDEVSAVQERFEEAISWLNHAQEEQGVMMLLDALKRTGLAEKAFWLAMSRVEDAQRDGEFERAERWLREARNCVSSLPADSRSTMINFIKEEDDHLKQAQHAISASFAPRYGSDPGFGAILKLYGIECVDAFWADLADVMRTNEHVARQLVERLAQLQQFAQQTGSTNANIHSLAALQGNVSRMELTDSARLIFKKVGRTLKLVALYPNHDAYDEAIKQRWELMNRIQRG